MVIIFIKQVNLLLFKLDTIYWRVSIKLPFIHLTKLKWHVSLFRLQQRPHTSSDGAIFTECDSFNMKGRLWSFEFITYNLNTMKFQTNNSTRFFNNLGCRMLFLRTMGSIYTSGHYNRYPVAITKRNVPLHTLSIHILYCPQQPAIIIDWLHFRHCFLCHSRAIAHWQRNSPKIFLNHPRYTGFSNTTVISYLPALHSTFFIGRRYLKPSLQL